MALRAVPDHPKFADLKARINRPRYVALGCLEAIWHFAGRFTPQGNIGKYSDEAIEAWVEWDGDSGALIAALTVSGWLDEHSVYRIVVHDWAQHADKATKNALHRSGLKFCIPAVRRKRKHVRTEIPSGSTASPLPEPESEPEPEPEPRQSQAEKTCTAASVALNPEEPVVLAGREGERLALEMVRGELWVVPAADRAAWEEAYPGVNVSQELMQMREWLKANPKNRKTASGMRRFVVNWLSRAQNRSRPNGGVSNESGNRSQGRTDSNLTAARIAADRMVARVIDSSG